MNKIDVKKPVFLKDGRSANLISYDLVKKTVTGLVAGVQDASGNDTLTWDEYGKLQGTKVLGPTKVNSLEDLTIQNEWKDEPQVRLLTPEGVTEVILTPEEYRAMTEAADQNDWATLAQQVPKILARHAKEMAEIDSEIDSHEERLKAHLEGVRQVVDEDSFEDLGIEVTDGYSESPKPDWKFTHGPDLAMDDKCRFQICQAVERAQIRRTKSRVIHGHFHTEG